MPVPVRLTWRGLVGSWGMLTESVAVSEVVVVGLNFTAIVHDALPDRDGPQVPPVMVKSDASAPLMELLIEIVNGDLLVTMALAVLEDVLDTVP